MNTSNHLLFQLNLKTLLQQKVNYQMTVISIVIAALFVAALMIIIEGQYVWQAVLGVIALSGFLTIKACVVLHEKDRITAHINTITSPEEDLVLINEIEEDIHNIS
jgi:hypothetical protein